MESLVENTIATVLPPLTRALLELLLKKTVQKSIEEFTKKTAKRFAQEILTKLSQTVFRIALLRCIGFVGSQVAWASLQQNTAVIVQGVVASEARTLCRTGTKQVVKTVGQSLGGKKLPEGSSPRKGICRMTKSGVLAGNVYCLLVNGLHSEGKSVKTRQPRTRADYPRFRGNYTRKNAQVVTNLQQTCSNAVPTTCQQDVFVLLVPSLLTTCQRLVDNLIAATGCCSQQICYKLFQQLVIVLQFNNLSTSCE